MKYNFLDQSISVKHKGSTFLVKVHAIRETNILRKIHEHRMHREVGFLFMVGSMSSMSILQGEGDVGTLI